MNHKDILHKAKEELTGVFDDVTGRLVNLKQVTLDNDIMIIADDGTIIRIKAQEISKIGRNTKGVRIMKLKNGAKIVSVVASPSEEEEEELAENLEETPVEVVSTPLSQENIEYANEEANKTETSEIDEILAESASVEEDGDLL